MYEETLRTVVAGLPAGSVLTAKTAGWLYGLSCAPCSPVDVIMPPGCHNRRRSNVRYRRARLAAQDVGVLDGWPVTTIAPTLLEIVRRSAFVEAVQLVDQALNRRLIAIDELGRWAAIPGRHGRRLFRRVLEQTDAGAESLMETRLRLLLTGAGLPRPASQVELHDAAGALVGRADLYYRDARLAIEYDGSTHKHSITDDNRRYNRLLNAGYHALRFTAPDVLETPGATVAQVAAALSNRDLLAKPAS